MSKSFEVDVCVCDFHVFAETAGVSVELVTSWNLTFEGLVFAVGQDVLLSVGTVGKTAITTGKLTFERFFAGVDSPVYLQILHPGENLPATDVVADEWFLSSVYPAKI